MLFPYVLLHQKSYILWLKLHSLGAPPSIMLITSKKLHCVVQCTFARWRHRQ